MLSNHFRFRHTNLLELLGYCNWPPVILYEYLDAGLPTRTFFVSLTVLVLVSSSHGSACKTLPAVMPCIASVAWSGTRLLSPPDYRLASSLGARVVNPQSALVSSPDVRHSQREGTSGSPELNFFSLVPQTLCE